MRQFAVPAMLLALAACSQTPDSEQPSSTQTPVEAATPPATPPAAPPATMTPATRATRYMPLSECRVTKDERAEMPFREVLCAGPGGWALRIGDSDARQMLAVVAPGERETPLDLARANGGAFNSFIGTAEWRGPAREPFVPDTVILRHSVAEEPYPAPETQLLLAIRLAPTPCVLARVRPGPRQNDLARAAADAGGPCLAS